MEPNVNNKNMAFFIFWETPVKLKGLSQKNDKFHWVAV